MSGNYYYPLDLSWSTEEISSVLHFLNKVELAYEKKVDAKQLLDSYKTYNHVKTRRRIDILHLYLGS